MNKELIAKALTKFKNAKKIAVENFTMSYNELSIEAMMNLEMDASLYKWNSHTIQAIQYVLNNKRKMAVK
jgi:hypothetical protein